MDMTKLKEFVNGLTDEQKNELAEIIDKKKETGYEKPKQYQPYYCITDTGEIENCGSWCGDELDTEYYENANTYTIATVADADARADLLMRKLRRFAELNNKKEINWDDIAQPKFDINDDGDGFKIVESYYLKSTGTVYFSETETARKAIKEFKKELEWYFNEYL